MLIVNLRMILIYNIKAQIKNLRFYKFIILYFKNMMKIDNKFLLIKNLKTKM